MRNSIVALVTFASAASQLLLTAPSARAQQFSVVVEASPQSSPAPLSSQISFHTQPRGIWQRSATLSFGDGTPPLEWGQTRPRTVPHVFERPGNYIVTVSVTDTAGNVAQGSLSITVSDSVTKRVRFTGLTLTASAGDQLCVGSGADRICTTVAGPPDEGLPLPKHLADRLAQRDAEEVERARLHSALDSAGGQGLVHPDSLARQAYGDVELTDEQRRRVEDIAAQQNAVISDEMMDRTLDHLRHGRYDAAHAVLDSLANGAARTQYGGLELRDRIETGKRNIEFNRLSSRLTSVDSLINAAPPGSERQSELFGERERLVAQMGTLAVRQKQVADAALQRGDRETAREALLMESAMLQVAAEHAGEADRKAFLDRAYDASSRLLLASGNDDTVAQLRHVQVRARQGATGDTAAMASAATTYQRAVENAEGEGAALVRELYRGTLPPDSLAARLELLDPADRAKAVALLRTGQELREQVTEAQERQWRDAARMLNIDYDDMQRRFAADTTGLRRFREKISSVHTYSMRADSLRRALARCSGDACTRITQQLNDALNNADTRWYDAYYDYQLTVRDGGNFNATVVSPLTDRPIVFRRDATHRTRDVNVAFSEVEAYDTYFMNMPPEEVVRLGYTTIAVIAAGAAGGVAAGAVANLIAAPVALGAVEAAAATTFRHAATRFAATAITDGFVSTAADRYIISPVLNNTALRGSGVEIGAAYAGSIGAELRAFAHESALNSVMAAAFMPASKLGDASGTRAARAIERAGGHRFTAAAAHTGVRTTYELGGLAGWAVGQEYLSSTLDGRAFNAERVGEETLNGMLMMSASKTTRGLTESISPGKPPVTATPAGRRRLHATRVVEQEYTQARTELMTELARVKPDPNVVDALRTRTRAAADELRRQNEGLAEYVGNEVVAERNRALDREVATVDGAALGARSSARVRGNVVEVEPWEVKRFTDDLKSAGLDVRRSGAGALVRDPASGESAVVVPREYATPEAQRAARKRARAHEAIRAYEVERLSRLPKSDAEYMRDKYTRRWEELGRPEADTRAGQAERGARARRLMEDVIRTQGAELVPRPGLATSAGRNAQVRNENGRWRVEYDPEHATYLDIKEEARHLSNEVAGGYFRDGATTVARERIAELREARDRAERLMAVEAQPRAIYDALNRAADERTRLREVVGPDADRTVSTLGAPIPRSVPERIANGTPAQRSAWGAIEDAYRRLGEQWHEQEVGLRQMRRGVQQLRTLAERETWPGANRHIELLERNLRTFERVTDVYQRAHERLKELQDAVLRDPQAADAARHAAEALDLTAHVDLPVLRATRNTVHNLQTSTAWNNRWSNRLNHASSQSRVNRQMGEAAIAPPRRRGERGGPAYDHIMNNIVRAAHPNAAAVRPLFKGLEAYSGVFDGVHGVFDADGKLLELVILEAKGGDSRPSTRIVSLDPGIFGDRAGVFRAEQGTPEHTMSTLLNLLRRVRVDPEAAAFAPDVYLLEGAIRNGQVSFFYANARTPSGVEIQSVPFTGVQETYALGLRQYVMREQLYGRAMPQ